MPNNYHFFFASGNDCRTFENLVCPVVFFLMNFILCVEIAPFLKSTLFEFENNFNLLRVIYPDITTLGWI
jgi:hypothetical protein